jgi:hypothetical protein
VYDSLTLPDNLALLLLTLGALFFAKYQQHFKFRCLIASGLLIGFSFSAKEYYILPAIPAFCSLAIWGKAIKDRVFRMTVFTAAVFSGVGGDLIIHLFDSGQPFAHFLGNSEFFEIMAERNASLPQGFQGFARQLLGRFNYLKYLFLDQGAAISFCLAWGFSWLVFRWRHNAFTFYLTSSLVLISTFIVCMPASVSPWIFVEMQPRYISVFLPFLSLGAGHAISHLKKQTHESKTSRLSLNTAVILGLGTSFMMPNDLNEPAFNRSARLKMDGIERIIKGDAQFKINTLIFAETEYGVTLPDSLKNRNLTLKYFDGTKQSSIFELQKHLGKTHQSGLFISRERLKRLNSLLARGELQPEDEAINLDSGLKTYLQQNGYEPIPIMVPDTVFMLWASRLGLVSHEQQLVGWLYLRGRKLLPNEQETLIDRSNI